MRLKHLWGPRSGTNLRAVLGRVSKDSAGRDLFALAALTPCKFGLRHPDSAVITASCVPNGPRDWWANGIPFRPKHSQFIRPDASEKRPCHGIRHDVYKDQGPATGKAISLQSPLYGSRPVVHSIGALYDTIRPLDVDHSVGNGFSFDHYGSEGFRWTIDRAMDFHALPAAIREREIRRIMGQSAREFSHNEVARRYIAICEQMLENPLVEHQSGEAIQAIAASAAANE